MALNITTAVLGSGCNTAVASPSLVQWDQGQILKIQGPQLPEDYQVEFSVESRVSAMIRIGGPDGVEIPNELLQQSGPITAYLVLHEGEDDRETEYWITIYIKPRKPPEVITPDPDEAGIIDQAIAALNAASSAVSKFRADLIRNAGNILAEIGTFSPQPTPAISATWTDGNTRVHLEGSPAQDQLITLYSFGSGGSPADLLEYDTDYEILFGSDDAAVSLVLVIDGDEQELTGDAHFTIPDGTTEFSIELAAAAGTINTEVLIGIPYPMSHMEMQAEIAQLQEDTQPITDEQIYALFS